MLGPPGKAPHRRTPREGEFLVAFESETTFVKTTFSELLVIIVGQHSSVNSVDQTLN